MCNIHPIFHVSKLHNTEKVEHAVDEVLSQLNEKLEMLVEPEAVLGVRSGTGHNIRRFGCSNTMERAATIRSHLVVI